MLQPASHDQPARSLAALHTFDREMFLNNPCERVAGDCIWIQEDAQLSTRDVERRFAVNIAEDGPLQLPSDTYVCMGASSLGSGRSVFVDGIQVKGVGRTAHAPPRKHHRVTDGWLAIDRAIREIHNTAIVGRLSSIPQLPLAFAVMLPRTGTAKHRERLLLGRRGSPIRISHLDYLRGASYIQPLYLRIGRWRRFVNHLAGTRGYGLALDDVHAVFDTVIDRALLAIAEARLFGLTFANWHDNGDLFARAFDTEDVSFHFGAPLRPDKPLVREGETPRTYFTRTLWATVANTRRNVYACSLQYLQNAYIALDHLAAGVTYDQRAVDARYGWTRLRTGYRAALGQVLGRWLALPAHAAHAAAARLAKHVPLVPHADAVAFSTRELAEGLRDRDGRGAARTLGATLARHSALRPDAIDRMIAGLDRKRLAAERAELVATGAAIESGPAAHRVAAYRALLSRAERAASVIQIGR